MYKPNPQLEVSSITKLGKEDTEEIIHKKQTKIEFLSKLTSNVLHE